MLKNSAAITPGKSLAEAILLMRKRRVDTLLVTDDENHLKGFIDLESLETRYQSATSVGDIIKTSIFYVNKDDFCVIPLIAFSNAGLNMSLLLMRIRNLSALSPEQPWSMLFTTLSGATTMTNLTITQTVQADSDTENTASATAASEAPANSDTPKEV